MKSSICLIYILASIGFEQSIAQSQIEYPHCNCVEKLNYSVDNKEKLDGTYELICKNKQVVSGQYSNGLKSGKWTTKTSKGTTIKKAEYVDSKLHGKYELFYFDGTQKLIANFVNGQEDGLWQYFNDKGKLLKTGNYQLGKPIGVWTISDKAGKKTIATYNLGNDNFINTSVPPYFKKGGIERDDQSGEWYIKYSTESNPQSEVQPLGGYALSGDLFFKYLPIPSTIMDTYANFDFRITLQFEGNSVKSINAVYTDDIAHNPSRPTFPFIVSTNPPGKLKRVEHSIRSINQLRDDIVETIRIMGPWIGNATIDIHVPYVLNDVKRY
jgi:antitoxin component YwqK of YwqJK toxin-antitoxin module